MFQDDDHQDSSLPSIRQLFGIRASDNLDTLVSPPQRPLRANGPPPSAFPHQVVQAGRTSPRPEQRSPIRSASFSSGQVESHLPTTRGRLFAPRSTSSSSIAAPYASSSRSPTVSRARQSPAATIALPPISTAIPGFIPANRGRAVSDTEAFTRGGLASSPSGPRESVPPLPIHPSLQHQHREDPISIDNREHHRGHVGRSPVSATTRRSQAHSISQSSSAHDHSDDPSAPSHAWTTATSRSSVEYASSSQHEYAPHPYSSASIAARQNAGLPPLPTSSSAPTVSAAFTSASEGGSTHASPSRAERERVPPSAFPQYGVYSSGSRPRSGNSSEGDESRGGFGKYECEYCSKRFNRPSSLRIHINTHTGAKPFQCPFPSCGRRFSVMSNMRRHARTHGNMLSLPAGEDPPHARGDGGEAGGALGASSAPLTNGRVNIGHSKDTDAEMDVDELEGDDEDEMDYDAGAGSSESEGYPRSSRGRRPSSSDDPTGHFHSF